MRSEGLPVAEGDGLVVGEGVGLVGEGFRPNTGEGAGEGEGAVLTGAGEPDPPRRHCQYLNMPRVSTKLLLHTVVQYCCTT